VVLVEVLDRRLTEAFGASMAQQNEAVVRLEGRGIVGKLECPDRPCLNARAAQQILADESAVVAGSGSD
jgi:hypothetical protein